MTGVQTCALPISLATLTVNGANATKDSDTAYSATIATIAKGATVTVAGTATESGTVEVAASPWTVPDTAKAGDTHEFTVTVKNSDGTTAATITLTVTLTAVTDA